MKYLFLFTTAFLLNGVTQAATLCLTPTSHTIMIDGKKFANNTEKSVKISPIKINKNMKVVIFDQDGKAKESFSLKMSKNEKACIIRNTLYGTWMVQEMNKSCRC